MKSPKSREMYQKLFVNFSILVAKNELSDSLVAQIRYVSIMQKVWTYTITPIQLELYRQRELSRNGGPL